METATFAVSKGINYECDVELPTSVSQAKNLDENNDNALWMDKINREMENLKVTFDVMEDGTKIPVGHSKTSGYLVFDVSMKLERKARWVNDEHRTPTPEWPKFYEVV